jgi:hypothetical protein
LTVNPTTSRGIQGYVWAAVAGAISAVLLVFTSAQASSMVDMFSLLTTSPFFMLATFPLFLVGFGVGRGPCLVASSIASALTLAELHPAFALFCLLASILPVLGVVLMSWACATLPEGKSSVEGNVLTGLVAYAALVFLGIYVDVTVNGGSLLGLTQDALGGMIDEAVGTFTKMGYKLAPEADMRLHQGVGVLARFTPAFIMCSWLFLTVIALVVAQAVLLQKKWNLCPGFALARLHVPTGVIFAVAGTGLAASFVPAPYDFIGLNLSLVLGMPFFFVGLAIVHAWAAQTRMPMVAIIAFYLLITVVVHLVLLVALLGAIDQWVDFRKRFAERLAKQGGRQ